jgi:UDP-N-acetylglucosamine 2-epimerase (non-hydrolysing)
MSAAEPTLNHIASITVDRQPHAVRRRPGKTQKILTIFGTRPEVIKLAPVIQELERWPAIFKTVNVTPSQHADIVHRFARLFHVRVDYDLRVMQPDQSTVSVCARILSRLGSVLETERPELVIVQGDTTSAFAGALASFYHQIPVAHVEAGLRSRCDTSPFPEEMNRKLITRLATYHFAATMRNRDQLLAEGVVSEKIFVTGNPGIDALQGIANLGICSQSLTDMFAATNGCRVITLTTHRRESLGRVMTQNLRVLRSFIERHEDVALVFPVHPNPHVLRAAKQIFTFHPRILMTPSLDYADFVQLLSKSWLIVSDSGGIQEEAPSLGKPLLIIRENTERPETIEAGVARLVGGSPDALDSMLEEAYAQGSWIDRMAASENPFGHGDASKQIVKILITLASQQPVHP